MVSQDSYRRGKPRAVGLLFGINERVVSDYLARVNDRARKVDEGLRTRESVLRVGYVGVCFPISEDQDNIQLLHDDNVYGGGSSVNVKGLYAVCGDWLVTGVCPVTFRGRTPRCAAGLRAFCRVDQVSDCTLGDSVVRFCFSFRRERDLRVRVGANRYRWHIQDLCSLCVPCWRIW